jgi:hypothetical protein
MRAYRAAPGAAAALAPLPIVARPLLERAHEAVVGLQARLPGRGGALSETSMSQVAATGGARGLGSAALAKALAICAGTAGSAAVCLSAGVVPGSLGLETDRAVRPHLERVAGALHREGEDAPVVRAEPDPVAEPAPEAPVAAPVEEPVPEIAMSTEVAVPAEPSPTPEPPPAPSSAPPETQTAGAAAGEFGP